MTKSRFLALCGQSDPEYSLMVGYGKDFADNTSVVLHGCWSDGCVTEKVLYTPNQRGTFYYRTYVPVVKPKLEAALVKYRRWLDDFHAKKIVEERRIEMKMKVLEIAPMFTQRSWLVKVQRSDPPSLVTYGGAIGGKWFGPDSRPVDAAMAAWLSEQARREELYRRRSKEPRNIDGTSPHDPDDRRDPGVPKWGA